MLTVSQTKTAPESILKTLQTYAMVNRIQIRRKICNIFFYRLLFKQNSHLNINIKFMHTDPLVNEPEHLFKVDRFQSVTVVMS